VKAAFQKIVFEEIYSGTKDEFLVKLQSLNSVDSMSIIMQFRSLKGQSCWSWWCKCRGFHDGGHRLVVYLTLLFNMYIQCGYVPIEIYYVLCLWRRFVIC